MAPLKKVIQGSAEWACLEDAGKSPVGAFLASLGSTGDGPSLQRESFSHATMLADSMYLFDWSLPLNCPELMAGLKIPDYFADNVLSRTPEGSLYHDSWPSLFVAPAGITSELHVDAFCSNFWMALFEGKKRQARSMSLFIGLVVCRQSTFKFKFSLSVGILYLFNSFIFLCFCFVEYELYYLWTRNSASRNMRKWNY